MVNKRQHLAHDQTADDGESQRPAQFGAGAGPGQQRQGAEHRRQRGHQDGPEAQQRGLEDRLLRRLAVLALRFEREVHDHDPVLLDDADQEHDADDADDVQVLPAIISASSAPMPAEGSVEELSPDG